jgi:hypothetical protein
MDPWIDEHLVVLAIDQVVLATKANTFSIYNILMFKTYVTSLELQYLFDNQLVSNCFFLMYCLLTWTIQIIIFVLNMFEL